MQDIRQKRASDLSLTKNNVIQKSKKKGDVGSANFCFREKLIYQGAHFMYALKEKVKVPCVLRYQLKTFLGSTESCHGNPCYQF